MIAFSKTDLLRIARTSFARGCTQFVGASGPSLQNITSNAAIDFGGVLNSGVLKAEKWPKVGCLPQPVQGGSRGSEEW